MQLQGEIAEEVEGSGPHGAEWSTIHMEQRKALYEEKQEGLQDSLM